jgi:hypothetical protein
MLLRSWRWMEVGTDVHALLDPPRRVRVPRLGAYVVQNAVSAAMRGNRGKAAKDYVYILEVLRHPPLGVTMASEIQQLRALYLGECARFSDSIALARATPAILRDVAEQLIEARRAFGTVTEVAAVIEGRFLRLLAETKMPQ